MRFTNSKKCVFRILGVDAGQMETLLACQCTTAIANSINVQFGDTNLPGLEDVSSFVGKTSRQSDRRLEIYGNFVCLLAPTLDPRSFVECPTIIRNECSNFVW